MEINVQTIHQTIKELSKVVEHISQWFWLRRRDPNDLMIKKKKKK